MRIKPNAIISGITAVALLSAGVLATSVLRSSVAPASNAEPIAELPAPPPPAPWLPRLAAPRAVLVLDVSGSMGVVRRPADPERLQTVAALRFFDTYAHLWREVSADASGKNGEAGIAVVLLGTVAQTIDWSGDGELFLPVTDANRQRFADALVRYLGRPLAWGGDPGEDPRRAQDSDYAAALDAVAELVTGAPSPPAVLFLTDGPMDPHPCFTPLLSDAERERYRSCDRRGDVPETLAAVGGPPIFDRRAGEDPINKTDMPANVDVEAEVTARLARLLDIRFPIAGDESAPLAWFPIYLDTRPWWTEPAAVRRVLSGDDANARFWGTEGGVVDCRNADELVGHFVAAFARWFHLSALPVAPGGTRFQVPADTRAMAVQVTSDTQLNALRLVRDDRAVDLDGRGRFWTGVLADDIAGAWRLVPSGEAALEASVYLEPSYGWTLAVPAVCRQGSAGERPEARLYLCRFADGTAVAGGEVYANLPDRLPGSIRRDSGEVLPLDFALADGSDAGPRATYVADIPVARLTEGPALVTVRLDTLQSLGIPVRDPAQARQVEVEALTRLVVTDAQGRRLPGFTLEGVPHAPGWTAAFRGDAP